MFIYRFLIGMLLIFHMWNVLASDHPYQAIPPYPSIQVSSTHETAQLPTLQKLILTEQKKHIESEIINDSDLWHLPFRFAQPELQPLVDQIEKQKKELEERKKEQCLACMSKSGICMGTVLVSGGILGFFSSLASLCLCGPTRFTFSLMLASAYAGPTGLCICVTCPCIVCCCCS